MMQNSSIVAPAQRPGKGEEELLMHAHPQWRRYESEEEEISEAEAGSHHMLSPIENDDSDAGGIYDDADESTGEDEHAKAVAHGLFSPNHDLYRLVADATSTKPRSRPISVATTVTLNSVATFVPESCHRDQLNDHDDNADLTDPFTPSSISPRTSPLLLPQSYFVLPDHPNAGMISYYQSLFCSSIISDDGLEGDDEVLEATQIMYTAPSSRPSLISITSQPSTLAARMGRPMSPKRSPYTHAESRRTSRGLRSEENSRKRSLMSSDTSGSPDRSKRYSTVMFRDPFREGSVSYAGQSPRSPREQTPRTGRSSVSTLLREDVARRVRDSSIERDSMARQAPEMQRPRTSASIACVPDISIPEFPTVPNGFPRPVTFHRRFTSTSEHASLLPASNSRAGQSRPQSFRSASYSMAISPQRQLNSPLAMESPSKLTLPSSPHEVERRLSTQHWKVGSSSPHGSVDSTYKSEYRTYCSSPTTMSLRSRSNSTYSDSSFSGGSNSNNHNSSSCKERSSTYPYLTGKSQLSNAINALRYSSTLSLESEPEPEPADETELEKVLKKKPSRKSLMGFRLGRKKRI